MGKELIMPEVPVCIPIGDGKISLVGMFQEGENGRTAVICHPHPLYGGNMENNVVLAAQRAFAAGGWGTLRFNFRGVGGSGGEPGQGDKDALDLIAVSDYLRSEHFRSTYSSSTCPSLKNPESKYLPSKNVSSDHFGQLDLAGYSYGAWVALEAIRLGLLPDSLLLFSPPLDFMSFEGLKLPAGPVLITIGNQDEFCPVESLRKWLSGQSHAEEAVLEIFPYCDHFYWDFGRELTVKIEAFLNKSFA
jgi:alpha/beta superfamily hydrolase